MTPLPRVLVVVTNADLSGAPLHVRTLCTELRSRFKIHCVFGEDGLVARNLRRAGISVSIVPTMRSNIAPLLDLRSIRQLRLIIAQTRPEVIHAHSAKAGLLARIAGWLSGVPTIYTVHGWSFAQGAPALQRILTFLAEAACVPLTAKYICVSNYDARLALRLPGNSPQKIAVIHNGLPDCDIRSNPLMEPPQIVMVARLARQKDHSLLLKAFEKLGGQCTLLFVGAGTDTQEFKRTIQCLAPNSTSRIASLGPHENVSRHLGAAQIFVLLSKYEGLPLTIIEAMRAGLPVVASDVGGIRELVVDGKTGYLVPRGDLESVTKKLGWLVRTPLLRYEMGILGRNIYEQKFEQRLMIQQTESVYRAVLHRQGA